MNPSQKISEILSCINTPVFPGRSINITGCGAVSGSDIPQTKAIQSAIDELHRLGGGRVIIPSGDFLSGSLVLRSGVCLHLENEDSRLLFTTEINEINYPLAYSHWEASVCFNYRAPVYAYGENSIGITGSGVLDAGADYSNWWSWHHQVENTWSKDMPDLQKKARAELRRMNISAIPFNERIFGDGHFLRPNFIQFINCSDIILDGITVRNSPMWHFNPVNSSSITVRGVSFSSKGPNSDGFDPESSRYILVENCTFDTGDDCISIKSGRDLDGRNASPCRDIVIRGNRFIDGHGGIALGSEMSGGIQNLIADNNHFTSPNLTYVLRFKTNARRGGFIKDILLCNTTVEHVDIAPIHGTMLYEDGRNGDFLPEFSNINIQGLKSNRGEYGIFMEAFEEVPIKGLRLADINISNVKTPIHALNWEDPQMENVVINDEDYPKPSSVKISGDMLCSSAVSAVFEYTGGRKEDTVCEWKGFDTDGKNRFHASGENIILPSYPCIIRLSVYPKDRPELKSFSRYYRILPENFKSLDKSVLKLLSAGALSEDSLDSGDKMRSCSFSGGSSDITRMETAKLLYFLRNENAAAAALKGKASPSQDDIIKYVLENKLMAALSGEFCPESPVNRMEMASIAMQAFGVSYKNASSTMPVCSDADSIPAVYGTNIARALYFGFMQLEEDGNFLPQKNISRLEAVKILCRTYEKAD